MLTQQDVSTRDGRVLRVYDTGPGAGSRLAVFWQHGTPQVGGPPEPLFDVADRFGIRWVSHDRPGYGSSSPQPGRDVAAVAPDVADIADALGVQRFAVLGASGGGPHALACGALLPDRVLGVVSIAGLAPFGAEDLDWFGGMATAGSAELLAAVGGRQQLADHLAGAGFDPDIFTAAGRWPAHRAQPAGTGHPDAVGRVAKGQSVIDPAVVAELVGRPRIRDPLAELSPREREILALMAEGRTNHAIAEQLHLTLKTVETHVGNIFTGLGLAATSDDHRRVIAVLTYIRNT